MNVAVYIRVSTKDQTYNQQIEPCLNFCKMKGWNKVDIFKEVESSVKVRPVFEELLRQARAGKYQNIVVWRIDRAWRKSYQFIMDFENLLNRGINVCSVTEGFDPTTPMGKAMMTVIVALAELERTNISIATKQRLEILKKQKHLGRPFGSKDTVKRSSDGYKKRWSRQRGGKQSMVYTPERLDLKNESK